MSEQAPQRLGYQPALDGLRALAIGLVIVAHYGGRAVTGGAVKGGFMGVDLFFVLSGFLITVLLLEEWRTHGSIALGRFYSRRALRLFPALWVLLAVFVVLSVGWVGGTEQGLLTTLYGFTYTMNVLTAFSSTAQAAADHLGISHLWSLALEEQFYLLWPATLLVLLRRRVSLSGSVATVVAVIVLIAAGRELLHADHSGPLFRFDSILVGCVLGLLFMSRHQERLLRVAHSWAALLAAGAVALWLVSTSAGERIGPLHDERSLLFALASGVLILGAVSLPAASAPRLWRAVLTLSPVVFVGRISYALYLWHQPILVWLQRTRLETHAGSHPTALLGLVLSVSAATLSYYLVERRFLRLKWRLSRTASHDVSLEEAVHAVGAVPAEYPSPP